MENENKIENLENKLKRDKTALRIAIIICVVMMVAIIIAGLHFGISEFVSSIRQARVDEAIIGAAVNEMEISPDHVELHLLYKEWVPWLDCYSYTYAMVADGEIFIVGVNGTDEEVRYVDVIGRACP